MPQKPSQINSKYWRHGGFSPTLTVLLKAISDFCAWTRLGHEIISVCKLVIAITQTSSSKQIAPSGHRDPLVLHTHLHMSNHHPFMRYLRISGPPCSTSCI